MKSGVLLAIAVPASSCGGFVRCLRMAVAAYMGGQ